MTNATKIQLVTLLLQHELVNLEEAMEMLLKSDAEKAVENELKKSSLGKELL